MKNNYVSDFLSKWTSICKTNLTTLQPPGSYPRFGLAACGGMACRNHITASKPGAVNSLSVYAFLYFSMTSSFMDRHQVVAMKIVLDTNVLVSGLMLPESTSGTIISAWRAAKFDIALSQLILDELLCFPYY